MTEVLNQSKLLVVIGTRPEAIKMVPVIKAGLRSPEVDLRVCLTGQHRELVDDVLRFFEIQPHYRLEVMQKAQDLTGVTARILMGIRPILVEDRPDALLVQGDTVTCFASTLAAFYERIPVCHVEAGLRTYDLSAPFPEEGMRQLVTRLATLHFAATEENADNLLREGVSQDVVAVTGNTVIDALFDARKKVVGMGSDCLNGLAAEAKAAVENAGRTVLITGHRRESFGKGLENICDALVRSADSHPDVLFIYPVHPNPAVLEQVHSRLGNKGNVLLLAPLDYPTFVYLMQSCYLIVTDSGGIQEEAPALGKPVVVTRNKTERQEAVKSGQVVLAGTETDSIIQAIESLLSDEELYRRMSSGGSPYGDGKAAERIISRTLDLVRAVRQDDATVLSKV